MSRWIVCLVVLGLSFPAAAALQVNADQLGPDDPKIAEGNDLLSIARVAGKIKRKTEFESKEAYRERAAAELQTLMPGKVSPIGLLALDMGKPTSSMFESPVYFEYKPETQQLRLCLPISGDHYVEVDDRHVATRSKRIFQRVVPKGAFTGRNAFNVRIQVKRQELTALEVRIVSAGIDQCTPSMTLAPSEAEQAVKGGRIIALGYLLPPFLEIESGVNEATISDPIEESYAIGAMPFRVQELVLVTPSAVIFRQLAPTAR